MGVLIALSKSGGWLEVVDYQSFQCLKTLRGHDESVECLTISPDGRILIRDMVQALARLR